MSATGATRAAAAAAKQQIRWILVTGQPGCGKTTAVKKMVALLQSKQGVSCQGFYTEEVRDRSFSDSTRTTRVGFDVVEVMKPSTKGGPEQQRRGVLARTSGSGLPTTYKTGKYYVDVDSFEEIALPALSIRQYDNESIDNKRVIYVLDEIGRMELHSKQFPDHVRQLLSRGVWLVGAITAPRYGHRVPFCDEIASHPLVQVHNLTESNRDEVVAGLLEFIDKEWMDGKNMI